MSETQIHFDDGAAYERYMGVWSQLVGNGFIDWLRPGGGLQWLDVGCGNGAFTELIITRCTPKLVRGVDPSDAQISFARKRFADQQAQFVKGDAMALPFSPRTFDVAVMPLVIFFVPTPLKGVQEMARVVRPGGIVSAYGWDLVGGGFPYEILQGLMKEMGAAVGSAPNPGAAQIDTLRETWKTAGLHSVETKIITVQRTFTDFDDYWATVLNGPSVKAGLSKMTAEATAVLKNRLRARLPSDAAGRITYGARAHAVKGCVPI